MLIHVLRRWFGAALAVASLSSAAADPGGVPFLVTPGLSEDATLGMRVAELLIQYGAPIVPRELSPGQATHVVDAKSAVCGLTLLRDAPGREHYHWIAKSSQDSIVIAGPREFGTAPPSPGDHVAAFYVKAFLDAADRARVSVIPMYSFEQIELILRSGRTRFMLGLQSQVEQLNEKYKIDLVVTQEIGPLETWLACNEAVRETEAAAIQAAWRRAYDEGALRRVYASAHMDKTLPPP